MPFFVTLSLANDFISDEIPACRQASLRFRTQNGVQKFSLAQKTQVADKNKSAKITSALAWELISKF